MTCLNLITKEYKVEKKPDKNARTMLKPYVDFICGRCKNSATLPKANYKEDKYCKKCIRHENAKTKFFIKAKDKYGNKYDLSKVVFICLRTKVEVVCTKHNISHWITPINFTKADCKYINRGGCPECAK